MDALKPCPFCGNTGDNPRDLQGVHIAEQERTAGAFGLPAEPHKIFYVRCGRCFAQGGNGVTGYRALTGRAITEQEARQIAIDRWNRRAL